MSRLLDYPIESLGNVEAILRPMILADVVGGLTENDIFADHVGVAIRTARKLALDEHEVEVAASVARRIIAKILAEFRTLGFTPLED
jgi:hypothetical protein